MTNTTRRSFLKAVGGAAAAGTLATEATSASTDDRPDRQQRQKHHQLVYWEPPLGIGQKYLTALGCRLDEKLRAFDGCAGVSGCSWWVGDQQVAIWVKMELGTTASRAEAIREVATELLAHERQRHHFAHLDRTPTTE